MPLTDKVAVIIGATGAWGPPIARAFAHEGAKLVLVGTQEEELAAVKNELGFREKRVMTQIADAREETAMVELAELVMRELKRVDILMILAGGYKGGSLQETSNDVWDHMLNANLRTAVNSIRAFLPHLGKDGSGRIITTSSGITSTPPPNVAAYVTAKAAVETMTLALAQEVKDRNITANVVL